MLLQTTAAAERERVPIERVGALEEPHDPLLLFSVLFGLVGSGWLSAEKHGAAYQLAVGRRKGT
jgi:hypothetical protein